MVEWRISAAPVGFREAEAVQEARAAEIAQGGAGELVWLLEHPPLYTAGVSAKDADLLDPDRFPVYATRRGGEHTYHGPGQRVGYAVLDLNRRGRDLRAHVRRLEAWVIETLKSFDLRGERRAGRVGVWIDRDRGREEKIAAIGVRVRRWVAFHGVALNNRPDLSHFDGIVPCGIRSHGVTSLADLGRDVSPEALDQALMAAFDRVFGAEAAPAPQRAAAD